MLQMDNAQKASFMKYIQHKIEEFRKKIEIFTENISKFSWISPYNSFILIILGCF